MDKLKALEKKRLRVNRIFKLFTMNVIVSLVVLGTFAYTLWDNFTDKTIWKTFCPYSDAMDKPMLLSNIKNGTKIARKNYIKSFVRSYLRYSFPRKKEDASMFLERVIAYSDSSVSEEYEKRYNNIDKYKEIIASGNFYRFYESRGEGDLKISYYPETGTWNVILNTFLIKHENWNKEYRFNPIVTMTIKNGPQTTDNPYGLYVHEVKYQQIINYVTGDYKLLEI